MGAVNHPSATTTPLAAPAETTPGTTVQANTAPDAAAQLPPSQPEPARLERLRKASRSSTERVQAFRERQKAKQEAAPAAPAMPATPEPKPAPVDDRTDAQLATDLGNLVAVFLWPVVGLLASLFRWELLKLETEERAELGRCLVPLARRWTWLASVSRWVGPLRLLEAIRSHLRPKPKPQPATPAAATAPATAAQPETAPATAPPAKAETGGTVHQLRPTLGEIAAADAAARAKGAP